MKIYLHQQQSNLINQMMLELIGCEFQMYSKQKASLYFLHINLYELLASLA